MATYSSAVGQGLVALGAGMAMIGASGVGAGQGIAAGRAAEAVGRNPEAESKIRSMLILGMGIAESAAIYALIISILLLFVFKIKADA
ncbi:MAG: ATP synthase F0 subunit C [Mycoplasmataceae bacterium]|nr:ATP synthase F0 subunit C [Mycoplasmataceae bacterium]